MAEPVYNSNPEGYNQYKKSGGWLKTAGKVGLIAGGALAGGAVGMRTLPRILGKGRLLKAGENLVGKVLYVEKGSVGPLSLVARKGHRLDRVVSHLSKKPGIKGKSASILKRLNEFFSIPRRHYAVGGTKDNVASYHAEGLGVMPKKELTEFFGKPVKIRVASEGRITGTKGKARKAEVDALKARLGKVSSWKPEDLCAGKNCEHFARTVGEGKNVSKYLRSIKQGAGGGAALGGVGTGLTVTDRKKATTNAWSDEARKASAEARRNKLKSGAKSVAGGVIGAASSLGWREGVRALTRAVVRAGMNRGKIGLALGAGTAVGITELPGQILAQKLAVKSTKALGLGEEGAKAARVGHLATTVGMAGADVGRTISHLKNSPKFMDALRKHIKSSRSVKVKDWLKSKGETGVHPLTSWEDTLKIPKLSKFEEATLGKASLQTGMGNAFAFRSGKGGKSVEVIASKSKAPADVLAHELGHIQDFRKTGNPKAWESDTIGTLTGQQVRREKRAWQNSGFKPVPGSLESYESLRKGTRVGAAVGAASGYGLAKSTESLNDKLKAKKPTMNVQQLITVVNGGPGSGFHGHKGIPGHRGGSVGEGKSAPSAATSQSTLIRSLFRAPVSDSPQASARRDKTAFTRAARLAEIFSSHAENLEKKRKSKWMPLSKEELTRLAEAHSVAAGNFQASAEQSTLLRASTKEEQQARLEKASHHQAQADKYNAKLGSKGTSTLGKAFMYGLIGGTPEDAASRAAYKLGLAGSDIAGTAIKAGSVQLRRESFGKDKTISEILGSVGEKMGNVSAIRARELAKEAVERPSRFRQEAMEMQAALKVAALMRAKNQRENALRLALSPTTRKSGKGKKGSSNGQSTQGSNSQERAIIKSQNEFIKKLGGEFPLPEHLK